MLSVMGDCQCFTVTNVAGSTALATQCGDTSNLLREPQRISPHIRAPAYVPIMRRSMRYSIAQMHIALCKNRMKELFMRASRYETNIKKICGS